MEPQDALLILQQTPGRAGKNATLEDARAFLAICADRGLSPFVEASPIITDYTRQDGEHVHGLAVKEHYAVQERWASQCGGYTISRTEVAPHDGGLRARVWIISNRDYADVGKMAAMVPGFNFHEELRRFEVCSEALVTEREFKRRPPATKTWEWIAEKRAREGALRQKFGKEPSQSRQIYANALTQEVQADAIAQLYPARQPYALPAGAPAPEEVEGVIVEQDPPDDAQLPAMTLEEAEAFETPGGIPYGGCTLDQLTVVIEFFEKRRATGKLTTEDAEHLRAAKMVRAFVLDGAAAAEQAEIPW